MSVIKVAGIAGGVGTTVLATLLNGTIPDPSEDNVFHELVVGDCGRYYGEADVIVARNDYRCVRALVSLAWRPALLVVIAEPNRSLTTQDIEDCLGVTFVTLPFDYSLARADDAGLLDSRRNHRRWLPTLEAIRHRVTAANA